MAEKATFKFTPQQRLRSPAQFAQVQEQGTARHAGPLRIAAIPNDLGFNRLGLAISRRCGIAVERNRIKRQLREAFRLLQHELPKGYDLVIAAKTHDRAAATQYRQWLTDAMLRLHRHWKERGGS